MLILAYDGTNFNGWQRQDGLMTVQGELENALKIALKEDILVEGTGRTDAGVHALGQTCSFKTNSKIPIEKLPLVLNNILAKGKNASRENPSDIRILDAKVMEEDFHSRFSAKGKTYKYILSKGDIDIFRRNYVYFVNKDIDIEKMREASALLVGTMDYKAFQSSGATPKKTTVRTIYSIDILEEKEDIIIRVTGNGFLYNMVRIIVGTLVDIGTNKISKKDLEDIISSKDRQRAGHTAPPQGLYMEKVYFEEIVRNSKLKNTYQI